MAVSPSEIKSNFVLRSWKRIPISFSKLYYFSLHHIRRERTGANAQLQLLLENSKLKKRHNYIKKKWKITSPIGMVSLRAMRP